MTPNVRGHPQPSLGLQHQRPSAACCLALDRNRPVKCGECNGCVSSCVRLKPEDGGEELGRSRITSVLAQALPGFIASYFLLDLLGLCNSERALFQGDVLAETDALAHTTLGALLSFLVFHMLGRFGVSASTRFKAVAISAYSFYYAGVAPEITMAWSLDPVWMWVMLVLPATVLAAVRLRRPAPARHA